jgi:hypothetical protein
MQTAGQVLGRTCGAQNIPALRSIHASRRLDGFWKDHLNAYGARNDCLASST